MEAPEHVLHWLQTRDDDVPDPGWRAVQTIRADSLELESLTDDLAVVHQLRAERWGVAVVQFIHGGHSARLPMPVGAANVSISLGLQAPPLDRLEWEASTVDSLELQQRLDLISLIIETLSADKPNSRVSDYTERAALKVALWQDALAATTTPPLSHRAAYYLALIAENAKDTDQAAYALRTALALSRTGSLAHLRYGRLLAGALDRANQAAEAARVLEELFGAGEDFAVWVIGDLVALSMSHPQPHLRAATAARALWLSIRTDDDIPSAPEHVWSRSTTESRTRVAVISAALQEERWLEVIDECEEYLIALPESPGRSWVLDILGKALVAVGRPEDALDALDNALREGDGTPPPAEDTSTRDARLEAVKLLDPALGTSIAILTRPIPDGLHATTRASAVIEMVSALQKSDHGEDALAVLSRELELAPESHRLWSELGKRAYPGTEPTLFTPLADAALDGGVLPPSAERSLLWYRAHQLQRRSEILGAVTDALRHAGSVTSTAGRLDGRRITNIAIKWARESGDSALAERACDASLAFGVPTRDRAVNHASELLEWAETLALAERTDDAVGTATAAVTYVVSQKLTKEVESTVRRWLSIMKQVGRDSGSAWIEALSQIVETLSVEAHSSTIALVHWQRAYNQSSSNSSASLADTDVALSLARKPELSVSLRYDIVRLASTAAGWAVRVDDAPRAKRYATEVLALAAEKDYWDEFYRDRLLSRQAEALCTLGRSDEALARLRSAQDSPSLESGFARDDVLSTLHSLIRSDAPTHAIASDLLDEFVVWHRRGASNDRVALALADASLRLEIDDSVGAFDSWRFALSLAPTPRELVTISGSILEAAEDQIRRSNPTLGIQLVDLHDEVGTDSPRAHESALSTRGMLLNGVGDVDSALRYLSDAAAHALRLSDAQERATACIVTGGRLLIVGGETSLVRKIAESVHRDIAAGVNLVPIATSSAHGLWQTLGMAPPSTDQGEIDLSTDAISDSDLNAKIQQVYSAIEDGTLAPEVGLPFYDAVASRALAHGASFMARLNAAVSGGFWMCAKLAASDHVFDSNPLDRDAADQLSNELYGRAEQTVAIWDSLPLEFSSNVTLCLYLYSDIVEWTKDPDVRAEREEWVVSTAIIAALRLDARAAGSRNLATRQAMLQQADGSWSAAITVCHNKKDWVLAREIIAVRRSSLVLGSNESVESSARRAVANIPTLSEEEGELIGSIDDLAIAASSALIAAVDDGAQLAVGPRPMGCVPGSGVVSSVSSVASST